MTIFKAKDRIKTAPPDAKTGSRPVVVMEPRPFPAAAVIVAVFLLASLAPGLKAGEAASGAGAASAGMSEYLSRGESAFRAAMELDSSDPEAARDHYRKAIMNFELITREGGIRNGELYYNIGNAWFRLGDTGRAILNYRRAALYRPGDRNLVQNLEFARSRRSSSIEAAEKDRVFKTLFFLHYDIPSRIRLAIFLVSFAMAWAAATAYLFLRKSWVRALIIVSAISCAVFFASLAVERSGWTRKPPGVIIADGAIARKGDAETYQPTFTEPLSPGAEVRLVERRADWWQIELEDGTRCWVPSDAGELVVNW